MYAKIFNNIVEQYPYTVSDLKRDNPHTSFPLNISDEIMLSYGLTKINDSVVPEVGEFQYLVELTPEKIGDLWYRAWEVRDVSSEDKASMIVQAGQLVRNKRNRLLLESDWTQVKDAKVNQDQWAIYRQALRDISSQEGFPMYINWPIKPE